MSKQTKRAAAHLRKQKEKAEERADMAQWLRDIEREQRHNGYSTFLSHKLQFGCEHGFEPEWMPDLLFQFQVHLVKWALRKGRAAIFADCGLGKTPMQLTWAENVARKTGKSVLILTPLSVAFQTVAEGEKFGIDVKHVREKLNGARIAVTNYERLHYFNSNDFAGVVCDESSILKNYDGATRKAVTEFMRCVPYRLLCTATAAPNDYLELGTSSEALGDMGFADMLSVFFKKKEKSLKSRKDELTGNAYRFRGHSEQDFWRWICSWARAMRKPSDLGFDDNGFVLPDLHVNEHVVHAKSASPGMLFNMPAVRLHEQREELRRTLHERCEKAADLHNSHRDFSVAWCQLNDEGDALEKLIPDAIQVSGSDSDEHKEEVFRAFSNGDIRVLVTKPTIAGFGLNWQHCSHQTFFPSHSYEQYYQAVRRMWRFGRKGDATVDIITTDGQAKVLANLQRKAEAASVMFDKLVAFMNDELKIKRTDNFTQRVEVPPWL